MATATAPEVGTSVPTPQYSLTNPPPGAYFDFDEVKGDRGQKTLGTRPLLTWRENQEGLDGFIAFYGVEGGMRIPNGTSIRVTGQGIARRVTEKAIKEGWGTDNDRINNETAKLQLEYRPGKRQGGQSTAQSRAVAAAKKAAGKIGGDAITSMLERVAAMSEEQRSAFALTMGLDPAIFELPEVEEEENEEGENGADIGPASA